MHAIMRSNAVAPPVDGGDGAIGTLAGAAAVRERRTTQELVFEFLRDAILSGRLSGGSRLVQDKLAADLNVSRVPVREALLQLEAEGFVRMEAHRGASVVWLSPEEVAEIFEIRIILVSAAVRKTVPLLSDEQIERLGRIAVAQSSETDMAARVRLNYDFYDALLEPLGRPRWRTMMDKLEREVERFLQPIDRPHLGHIAFVEACRQRDGEAAVGLIGDHLAHVGERAVARLREAVDRGEMPARPGEPLPRRGRANGHARVRR